MGMKTKTVEEGQLPRWVYAMMKANEDPSDESDSPASRVAAKMRAEMVYNRRQQVLANRESQSTDGRLTGLEWKTRPRTTFTSQELDKIIPTRRTSYVFLRSVRMTLIGSAILSVTCVTIFTLLAVCVSLKLDESASTAWILFKDDPVNYFHHVLGAIDWT